MPSGARETGWRDYWALTGGCMQTQPLRGVNIAVNVQPRNVSSIAKTQPLSPELQADVAKSSQKRPDPSRSQLRSEKWLFVSLYLFNPTPRLPTPLWSQSR